MIADSSLSFYISLNNNWQDLLLIVICCQQFSFFYKTSKSLMFIFSSIYTILNVRRYKTFQNFPVFSWFPLKMFKFHFHTNELRLIFRTLFFYLFYASIPIRGEYSLYKEFVVDTFPSYQLTLLSAHSTLLIQYPLILREGF